MRLRAARYESNFFLHCEPIEIVCKSKLEKIFHHLIFFCFNFRNPFDGKNLCSACLVRDTNIRDFFYSLLFAIIFLLLSQNERDIDSLVVLFSNLFCFVSPGVVVFASARVFFNFAISYYFFFWWIVRARCYRKKITEFFAAFPPLPSSSRISKKNDLMCNL